MLITLDLWQTLIRSDPNYKQQFVALLVAELDYDVPADKFLSTMREIDATSDQKSMEAMFDLGFMHRMNATLHALGLPLLDSRTERRALGVQAKALHEFPPKLYDGREIEVLTELKNLGHSLYVVSNTGFIPGTMMRYALSRNGLKTVFDGFVFSNEEGVCKPSGRMWTPALTETNATTGIHIGDNAVADGGAVAAGLEFRRVHGDGDPSAIDVLKEIASHSK